MIDFISIKAGDRYSGYKDIFINPNHIVRIEPDADEKAMLCFDNGEFIHTPYNMPTIKDILCFSDLVKEFKELYEEYSQLRSLLNEDHQDDS